ncbi:substrate-binding domain-containing protein [Svornostia abyssi]|uniref:Substrate-binding domain-containing protein n=1 Tax=Svornostia abyssi TaxID=2898438 RepID=A0ABY5PLC6_9ACTN|nr:substrate-binding domain-containing protein [Parviterribacteraceae bacterium J379]
MKTHTRGLAAVAALTAVAAVPATANAATIAGSGSSASTPYVEALFKAYKKVDKKNTFTYSANNGNAGAKDVQAGRSAFAIQTRPPLPSDSGLVYSKLFLDALTVSVNPANKLNDLQVSQVKDIFTGKVTEWSAFSGSGFSQPISAFGRVSTAGLYTFFTSAVLDGEAHGTNVTPLDKDGEVAVALSKNPQGIGYVGLANSRAGSGVKRLALNGVPPTPATIKSLKYPLSRYAWLVTSSTKPNQAALKFGDWIRSSYEAGVIIDKLGAVPAFNATKPKKKKKK